MISEGNSAGYIGYAISLWIITAIIIFVLDVRTYRKTDQIKEWKTSLILGWINLAFGLILFITKETLEWMGF